MTGGLTGQRPGGGHDACGPGDARDEKSRRSWRDCGLPLIEIAQRQTGTTTSVLWVFGPPGTSPSRMEFAGAQSPFHRSVSMRYQNLSIAVLNSDVDNYLGLHERMG